MTTPQTVLLSPIDAWFFRDGRPYNEGEGNQTDVVSQFPPPATTLVGALRAGLARERNWDGRSNWATIPELAKVLGRDFDDLGSLRFHGPWFVRTEDGASELLFHMPLHVLGRIKTNDASNEPRWQPQCLLTPGKQPTHCDLGSVSLPVTSAIRAKDFASQGLKEPAAQWVTQPGLDLIHRGNLPMAEHVIDARELWRHEPRVGLKRSEDSRTTEQGALYSPRFVRLKPGVSLAMSVSGLPNDWSIPDLMPLGGEGRLADCRSSADLRIPDFLNRHARDFGMTKQIAVTLLTPLLPDDADHERGTVAMPAPNQQFFECSGTKVISACVGKPQSLGGWDSIKREPLPLRPVLPAGSTWFLEVSDPTAFAERAGSGFGLKSQYGFGQVALGVWPLSDDSGETT